MFSCSRGIGRGDGEGYKKNSISVDFDFMADLRSSG